MALYKTEQGVQHDQLLGGPGIAIRTANVTLKAGQDIARGQLLCKQGDKYEKVNGSNAVGEVIATEAVNAKQDTVITVFTQGCFHASAVVLDGSAKLEASVEKLKTLGIVFTDLK